MDKQVNAAFHSLLDRSGYPEVDDPNSLKRCLSRYESRTLEDSCALDSVVIEHYHKYKERIIC